MTYENINFYKCYRPVANVPVQEIPGGKRATVYWLTPENTKQDDIPNKASNWNVWLACFFLVVGVAFSPIDFAVGAVIGIPAFGYLLAIAKGR